MNCFDGQRTYLNGLIHLSFQSRLLQKPGVMVLTFVLCYPRGKRRNGGQLFSVNFFTGLASEQSTLSQPSF